LRKALFVVALVFAFSLMSLAQAPKAEVFGGYQYTNADIGGVNRINLNGWNAQFNAYFNRNLGVSADFAGNYGSPDAGLGFGGIDSKAYSYMFGPVFRAPMGKATPYVHALFGGTHLSLDNPIIGNLSDSAFSFALGGGFDVNIGKRAAFRVAQFDYYATRFSPDTLGAGDTQNHFRVSTGLVFHF
jgi:hypothetical protein